MKMRERSATERGERKREVGRKRRERDMVRGGEAERGEERHREE